MWGAWFLITGIDSDHRVTWGTVVNATFWHHKVNLLQLNDFLSRKQSKLS